MTEQNELLDKAKGFWSNYNKIITYGGSAIIVLLLSWIGYQKLIKEPKELKAGETKTFPMRFYVSTDVPQDIKTVTLSYAFYNTVK